MFINFFITINTINLIWYINFSFSLRLRFKFNKLNLKFIGVQFKTVIIYLQIFAFSIVMH